MQSAEEVAREVLGTCADYALRSNINAAADLIRARDAEVRAETLAGFEREDTEPFHGHGYTEPGYWRLVGPKHYKPLPEAPSEAAIQALLERFGSEQKDQP